MKKSFICIIMTVAALLSAFAGCAVSEEKSDVITKEGLNITYVLTVGTGEELIQYFYDNKTKVMYIKMTDPGSVYSGNVGICPLYDSDGSVMTYDEWVEIYQQ